MVVKLSTTLLRGIVFRRNANQRKAQLADQRSNSIVVSDVEQRIEIFSTFFQAMLKQTSSPKAIEGNPGLANEEQAPAWTGFRQMRVASVRKESDSGTS